MTNFLTNIISSVTFNILNLDVSQYLLEREKLTDN